MEVMEGLWDDILDWDAEDKKEKKIEKKQSIRSEALMLSPKFLYRRAFSELTLFDLLKDTPIENGLAVNILTGGNIDQLSYLSFFVRRYAPLDNVAVSTWCMSAEDAKQMIDWMEEGKIKHLDIYVGEIFKGSYRKIWEQLKEFYGNNPDKGRLAIFKCHAKIIAAQTKDFDFSVQTSANMDTNPRTEQACIQICTESYNFYKSYFDGIKSFE